MLFVGKRWFFHILRSIVPESTLDVKSLSCLPSKCTHQLKGITGSLEYKWESASLNHPPGIRWLLVFLWRYSTTWDSRKNRGNRDPAHWATPCVLRKSAPHGDWPLLSGDCCDGGATAATWRLPDYNPPTVTSQMMILLGEIITELAPVGRSSYFYWSRYIYSVYIYMRVVAPKKIEKRFATLLERIFTVVSFLGLQTQTNLHVSDIMYIYHYVYIYISIYIYIHVIYIYTCNIYIEIYIFWPTTWVLPHFPQESCCPIHEKSPRAGSTRKQRSWTMLACNT